MKKKRILAITLIMILMSGLTTVFAQEVLVDSNPTYGNVAEVHENEPLSKPSNCMGSVIAYTPEGQPDIGYEWAPNACGVPGTCYNNNCYNNNTSNIYMGKYYITPNGGTYHYDQCCAGPEAIETTEYKAKTYYRACAFCVKR